MLAEAILTVAESKRLIARGIAADPRVEAALAKGIVAVAKGTTDSYIVEELLGKAIDKSAYVTGNTVPSGVKDAGLSASHPDLVLKDGKPVEGAEVTSIVTDMRKGDVFIKGANALNYDRQQVAVLVGHGTGGTLGATVGTLISRKITFLSAVGLEKSLPGDLEMVARLIADSDDLMPPVCALWVLQSEIVTEIEALETLAGVNVVPYGSGGVAGAEGSVRLLLSGDGTSVNTALAAIAAVQGEPPFPGLSAQ